VYSGKERRVGNYLKIAEKAKADDRRKGILYHEPRMARRPSMSMSMRGAVCLLVTMRRVD